MLLIHVFWCFPNKVYYLVSPVCESPDLVSNLSLRKFGIDKTSRHTLYASPGQPTTSAVWRTWWGSRYHSILQHISPCGSVADCSGDQGGAAAAAAAAAAADLQSTSVYSTNKKIVLHWQTTGSELLVHEIHCINLMVPILSWNEPILPISIETQWKAFNSFSEILI